MFACSFITQAGDVPVEFEEFHLSEVQNMASEEKLEQVLDSMKTNRVAMKGTFSYWNVIGLTCGLLVRVRFLFPYTTENENYRCRETVTGIADVVQTVALPECVGNLKWLIYAVYTVCVQSNIVQF